MDRRAFLGRLTTVAVAAGAAGCAGSSSNGGDEPTTETQSATAAETPMETAGEESTTTTMGAGTTSPPNIPRPGTPPAPTRTPGPTKTDDGPPDIPRPGTPPVPTRTTSCSLSHRVVDSGDDLTPSSESVLDYENLSSAAKRVVRRAVESDGAVSIPYDSRHRPPEFAYSDESHVYDIEYDGTTYRLFTGTGMGCPVVTATG